MMASRLDRQAGFSLWESLLVMVILSLVWWCFSSLPMGNFLAEWRCRLFCDQLAQALLVSQTQAISRHQTYRVVFETGGNQVLIEPLGQAQARQAYALPQDWQLLTFLQFHYFGDGRTEKFKTVTLVNRVTGQRHHIRFQLGSGRFEMD